jgi:dihydroneopterin aldolase
LTLLLVRISDSREAAQVALSGVDAVELVAEAPPDFEMARAIRLAFPGLLRLRLGDTPFTADVSDDATSVHADELAVKANRICVPPPAQKQKLVAILSPSDSLDSIARLRDHVGAVMLDAGDGARLIDKVGIAHLDAFASICRANGLGFGLAGGLEAPDVARLLLLQPDVLAFDTAVRVDHAAEGALDSRALDAIRALVPRINQGGQTATAKITKVTDRIFVRNFEVSLAIGAYQAEHGKSQRVRFSVVADVAREPLPPRDMRDVFSYDVIIETIRVLSERAHVTFVETLAEEVAASLLTHAEVLAVTVKVEKLDVIAGSVGIEILRRRQTP